MASVFDITKKQVNDQQSNRSDMIKTMDMPEATVDQFAGRTKEDLSKVNVKALSADEAKQWSAAMEAAQTEAEAVKAAPPPAPAVAPPVPMPGGEIPPAPGPMPV